MSLADALDRAATALPGTADAIRPANGDPDRVLEALAAEDAASVLGWLLREDAEAGCELAETWAEQDAAAAVFEALDDTGLPKAARKAVRRARHRLRSRGVALDETAPEARVARVPGAGVEEALETALISPYDPTGARIVTLVESNPSGGARIFQVISDVRKGILDCKIYGTSRGKARRFARELGGRERYAGVEIPIGSARAWLAVCAARQPRDRAVPRAFAESRTSLVEEGATPGALVREALEPAASARPAIELLRTHELGPWIPDGEGLRETAEALQELEKGKIIVSGGARREQVEEILSGAIERIFEGEEGELLAEWLAESAYLFWKKDREEDARACLAGTTDREVRRSVLEVALAPVLERLKEEEQEQEAGSLVVKP